MKAPASIRMAAVTISLLAISATLVGGAGPTATASAGLESPAAPTPAQDGGPIASALTPVAADPGFADTIAALGLDEATAEFLARTRSTVEVIDPHAFVVRHAFLDGSDGEESFSLTAGSGMSPGDPPELTYEVDGDELRYQLRYALDPAGLPPDLRAQLLEDLPSETDFTATTVLMSTIGAGVGGQGLGTSRLATSGSAGVAYTAQAPDTIQIVVDGVIKQGQSKALDKFVKFGESQGWTKTAKSYKAFKAGKKVWEAVEANELISSALVKVRALRECAGEPTNPPTQQQYRDDPGEQQRVLDELDETERDIRESTVVMFTSMLTNTGSSLVKAAPWLGFITGPANDYVKANLKAHIEERVRAAEQRVVPCHLSFTIKGSAPSKPGGITLSGKTCALDKPFTVRTQGDLVGVLELTPHSPTGGRWSYAGSESQAGFGVKGSGDYTVALNDDRSSGSLDFKFVTRLFIPGVGGQSGGGPVSLTLTKSAPCLVADG